MEQQRTESKLTPSKIMRLMQLAEATTPHGFPPSRARRRVLAERNLLEAAVEPESVGSSGSSKYNTRCESSGLLDLEQCEVFGDSCVGDMDKFSVGLSFSDSKSFNPGEMTGRSTGASEACDTARNESAAIDELAARLQQQSCDVAAIVRDSVCNFSFQTHRDLSRDEASFIRERGDLPVPPAQLDLNLTRPTDRKTEQSYRADTTSDVSVGSYFMKGSADLANMIGRADSPRYDVSMAPSLLEGDSRTYGVTPGFTTINDSDCATLDSTLDQVPTRQPRSLHVSSVHNVQAIHKFQTAQNVPSNHKVQNVPSVHEAQTVNDVQSVHKVKNAQNVHSVRHAQSVHKVTAPALCAPSLQHLAPAATRNEDSSLGLDNTLSISLIEKCLGKCDADFTPSMLFAEAKLNKQRVALKPALPTREPSTGQKETFTISKNDVSRLVPTQLDNPNFVVTLKQAGKSDTASSADSINTVLSAPTSNPAMRQYRTSNLSVQANKENICENTPTVDQMDSNSVQLTSHRSTDHGSDSATKSSISKSSPSACTVQENRISTSNVEDSPLQSSIGEALWPGLSPNFDYRELEQSINWHDLLPLLGGANRGQSHWVDVELDPVEGLVGTRATVTVKLTSVSDAWLSARLRLEDRSSDGSIAVDVPRFPVLLAPGASDSLTLTVTALAPLDRATTLAILLKDTCEDVENRQETQLRLKFVLPVVNVITVDDSDVLTFPPTQLDSETVKSFVIVSDCGETLNLTLTAESPKVFSIGSVEVIKREDIQRRLAKDHRLVTEEGMVAGGKYRAMKPNFKMACALPRGNALRVMMICHAPSNLDSNIPKATMNGCVKLHLVGTSVLLHKVLMSAEVGTIKLLLLMTGDKLCMTKDTHTLEVRNAGSVAGTWRALVRGACSRHLDVSPATLELAAGASGALHIAHARLQHACRGEGLLVLESVHEGQELCIELALPPERPAGFPIKTTHSELAWVREGRRELSLKNAGPRAATVHCRLHGAGFAVEGWPGEEALLTFAPGECRALGVVYGPKERGAHKAKLTLCLEQDSSSVKSVRLHGWCARGAGGVRWASATLTCGEMAVVFARRRSPVTLALENRAREPSFYSAKLLFNMQYRSLAATSRVTPARGVVPAHGSVRLAVELDWARLERLLGDAAATSLASLFVLVGPEVTRRRILRILNNDPDSEMTASPAEDLTRLKGPFQGEDPRLDLEIRDFDETKKSLAVLTGSIQELTAQIELTRDNGAESTIVIADETAIEHHTLLD